jgi:hypothetical protein
MKISKIISQENISLVNFSSKIDNKKTSTRFEKGRLKITIPKTIFSCKIKIII